MGHLHALPLQKLMVGQFYIFLDFEHLLRFLNKPIKLMCLRTDMHNSVLYRHLVYIMYCIDGLHIDDYILIITTYMHNSVLYRHLAYIMYCIDGLHIDDYILIITTYMYNSVL